ncbi:MAG: serine/threonine-protein kinase [Planctomycetota bacterium]
MADDAKSGEEHLGQIYDGDEGRYQIREILGAGGMGVVCLGTVVGTDDKVAVKFLHQHVSDESTSSRERFRREMKILQDLKAFRGIVQIQDMGSTPSGEMFLVMEYVAAPPLNQIIAENPNGIPQIHAVQIAIEILLVLEPIHRRKFLHRDLKPHNICVYDDPLGVRLLDFGLSKPYQDGEGYAKVTKRVGGKAAEIPGSPHYMAEEQFLRPKEVDERTDLYAVAIVLYEMIAGVPPFRGIYLQDILKQHRDKDPAPIEMTADGGPISYRLQNVLEKALAKKPGMRYQNASEFKEDLFDVLNMLNKARQPKKSLDNKYRIIRKIGAGGNSEVFEAEHLVENEMVALKITREGSSDWDEETLINEADRALNHDNIVKVLEFGLFDSRPALAMELVPGGTVEELVDQYEETGMPEGVFFRIIIDVCRGLHHAHQSNIVHRDVKPANMLRTLDGRIKIADFGIAKRFDVDEEGDDTGAKNTTLAKGTAPYISPEQCDLTGRVDRRADIYSLGCVMYELLSGHMPFRDGILIMQHLQSDPPPLKVKGEYKNADALVAVVERAMRKRKDERFQSMKELAQEIVRVSKLKPQRKTHKATPIDTGVAAFLEEKGEIGPRGRTGTAELANTGAAVSLKKLLAFGLPAVALLVVVLAFALKGGRDEVNPNPVQTPVGGDEDPIVVAQRAEYESAQALLVKEDFAELAELSAENLRNEMRFVGFLRRELRAVASGKIFRRMTDPKDAKRAFDDARAVAAGWRNIAPDDDAPKKLEDFSKAGLTFLKTEEPDALGCQALDRVAGEHLIAQAAALSDEINDKRRPRDWEEFVKTRQQALSADNGRALVALLDRSDDSVLPEGSVDAIKTFLAADLEETQSAPIRTSLFNRLRQRFLARAPRANSSALAKFVRVEILPVLGAEGMEAAELYEQLSSQGRSAAVGSQATSILSAGALALAEIEDLPEFRQSIQRTLGALPSDWNSGLDRLIEAGLPLQVYAPVVREQLSVTLQSDAFRTQVTKRLSSSSDAKTEARLLNEGYKVVAQKIGAGPRMLEYWRPQVAKFLKSDIDESWSSLEARLRGWKTEEGAAPATDVLVSFFDEMNEFVAHFPDATDRVSQVRGEATAVVRILRNDERWLSLIYLCQLYENLIGKPQEFLAEGRREYVRLLRKSNLIVSENYRKGLSATDEGLNLQWSQNAARTCIELVLEVPELERELVKQGLIEIGGPVARTDSGQARYTITMAPKSANGGFVGDSPAKIVRVKAALQLIVRGSETRLPMSVTYESKSRIKFDLEKPIIRTPVPSGGEFSVDVTDDSPAPSGGFATRVFCGDRELQARRRLNRNFYALRLNDFGKAGSTTSVRVEVKDAAGNAAAMILPEATVRAMKRGLVVARRGQLETQLGAQFDVLGRNAMTAKALSEMTNSLKAAGSSVRDFATHDAAEARTLSESLLRKSNVVMTRWMSKSGNNKSALEALVGPMQGLVTESAAFASQFGASDPNLGLSDSLRNRINLANSTASANLSNPSNGGNSGNSGSSGNTVKKPLNGGKAGGGNRPRPFQGKNVNVGGVNFIFVRSGSRGVWIADREVSVDFAQRYLPSAKDDARNIASRNFKWHKWRLAGNVPLAPMSFAMAKKLIIKLNAALKGDATSKCGVAVEFAIPTHEQWKAAGRYQLGGKARGLASGTSRVPSEYKPKRLAAKNPDYYRQLKPTGADPYAKGKFNFLSGNASEIVRSGRGYAAVGGDFFSARAGNAEKALDIGTTPNPGTRLNQGKPALWLSGLRLAIVPR